MPLERLDLVRAALGAASPAAPVPRRRGAALDEDVAPRARQRPRGQDEDDAVAGQPVAARRVAGEQRPRPRQAHAIDRAVELALERLERVARHGRRAGRAAGASLARDDRGRGQPGAAPARPSQPRLTSSSGARRIGYLFRGRRVEHVAHQLVRARELLAVPPVEIAEPLGDPREVDAALRLAARAEVARRSSSCRACRASLAAELLVEARIERARAGRRRPRAAGRGCASACLERRRRPPLALLERLGTGRLLRERRAGATGIPRPESPGRRPAEARRPRPASAARRTSRGAEGPPRPGSRHAWQVPAQPREGRQLLSARRDSRRRCASQPRAHLGVRLAVERVHLVGLQPLVTRSCRNPSRPSPENPPRAPAPAPARAP